MKRVLWSIAFLIVILTMGASFDRRENSRFPVARVECAQLAWTATGHTAKTTTANLNGIVYRIDILISEATNNPTVNVSYADQKSVVCLPAMSGLADGTKHFKNGLVNSLVSSADFDPVAIAGTVTVSVDPSANAGVSGLTVDVIFYLR